MLKEKKIHFSCFFFQEQVICTAWITAQYLKSIHFKGHCYCIGMQSMVEELSREGFHISDGVGVRNEMIE